MRRLTAKLSWQGIKRFETRPPTTLSSILSLEYGCIHYLKNGEVTNHESATFTVVKARTYNILYRECEFATPAISKSTSTTHFDVLPCLDPPLRHCRTAMTTMMRTQYPLALTDAAPPCCDYCRQCCPQIARRLRNIAASQYGNSLQIHTTLATEEERLFTTNPRIINTHCPKLLSP